MATTVRNAHTTWLRGALLAGGGLLLLALGALLSMLVTGVAVLVVTGLAGVGCLVVGCHLLAHGKANWVYPAGVLGGVAVVAGLGFGGQQLVLDLRGATTACEVADVARRATTTSTRVRYVHTLACPGATHAISVFPPYQEGTQVEVTYDPRGAVAPQFTEKLPGKARLVAFLVVITAGGLTILMLPFTAWRRGRRWASGSPSPPPAPPRFPPPQASQPWRSE